MAKEWLILGGSGLVGHYLTQMLIARGDGVYIVTRGRRPLASGAQPLIADISSPGWSAKITLPRCDVICHLAYATSGEEAYDRSVTVDSAVELLGQVQQLGANHFIYLGSMVVFGENTATGVLDETAPRLGVTTYAHNKIAATGAVLTAPSDIVASVLHPTGVYDRTSKRITFYKNLLDLGYIDSELTGWNNIVHAEDVASAIIQCADRDRGGRREEYIINGEAIAYSDWIGLLERNFGLAGKPRLPRFVSAFSRGPLGSLVRWLGWRRAIQVPAYKAALYRLQTKFSSDKAFRDFGYKPARRFIDEVNV